MSVVLVCGFPASGKSTITKKLVVDHSYAVLNRDTEGGTIADLLPKLEAYLINKTDVVLDNLFPTVESRKPFIDLCKKYGVDISCKVMGTSIEDAQFNAVQRMIDITGKFPSLDEIKKSKHPNIFPVVVLFKYKKEYQKPTPAEGFSKVEVVKFDRKDNPTFTNKALILDYDGTLRECIGGNEKYPVVKEQIEIKKNRTETLQRYKDQGYILLGCSNQSGIAKGELTYDGAVELFNHTNKLLGHDIDVAFCPHQAAPPVCYCRKPQVGFGVEFINKYKLKRQDCIFVGDYTTDKTFATRCGFKYVDQEEFFK
jgi:HAD superfamily hydrolase (TIGR01662 family)